jgi:zinc protease
VLQNVTTYSPPPVAFRRLDNGLSVLVISDHRIPVVTHMLWYGNGSADDPVGKSGIAHFLEHLMFKGTKKHPAGTFSETVAKLGGYDNAFTSYDYTAYYQKISKQHLPTVMAFEADRMMGLVLDPEAVSTERDVVREERRMRSENEPSSRLEEAMTAALYLHHPYRLPIIGWGHEIESLTREDALAYYERFYTPSNAFLVVAGDILPDEVFSLAKTFYGSLSERSSARPQNVRPRDPDLPASYHVTITDPRVYQPAFTRAFRAPSIHANSTHEPYALQVFCEALGVGPVSALYRRLVVEQKIAVGVGLYYSSNLKDEGRIDCHAVPAEGVSLPELEGAYDQALQAIIEEGLTESQIQNAKTRLAAHMIYAQDSAGYLAHIYGEALATGRPIDLIHQWPKHIESVTVDEIHEAGRKFFLGTLAITGYLLGEK